MTMPDYPTATDEVRTAIEQSRGPGASSDYDIDAITEQVYRGESDGSFSPIGDPDHFWKTVDRHARPPQSGSQT